MDVELIVEAHSNGFLKVEIRVLQNEEIINVYITWLSYTNWLENSRVYSEIIQVDKNITFMLYFESFATGGGSSGRLNQSQNQNEIIVRDEQNQNDSFESITRSPEDAKAKLRGFRLQLKKNKPIIELLMVDETTVTEDNKIIDDVWNDFMENYKLMLTFVEDSMGSSLFSQMLNKNNMVPSDDEDYSQSKIISDFEKIKSRENLDNEQKVVVNQVRHHLIGDKRNVWYVRDSREIKIQTYDLDTGNQDEVFIDLHIYFENEEIDKFYQDSSYFKSTIRKFIEKAGKIERDSSDGQYKLAFMLKKFKLEKKEIRKLSITSHQSEEVQSDSDDTEATSKYDISIGLD